LPIAGEYWLWVLMAWTSQFSFLERRSRWIAGKTVVYQMDWNVCQALTVHSGT
jgi:hypothetical protein